VGPVAEAAQPGASRTSCSGPAVWRFQSTHRSHGTSDTCITSTFAQTASGSRVSQCDLAAEWSRRRDPGRAREGRRALLDPAADGVDFLSSQTTFLRWGHLLLRVLRDKPLEQQRFVWIARHNHFPFYRQQIVIEDLDALGGLPQFVTGPT